MMEGYNKMLFTAYLIPKHLISTELRGLKQANKTYLYFCYSVLYYSTA